MPSLHAYKRGHDNILFFVNGYIHIHIHACMQGVLGEKLLRPLYFVVDFGWPGQIVEIVPRDHWKVCIVYICTCKFVCANVRMRVWKPYSQITGKCAGILQWAGIVCKSYQETIKKHTNIRMYVHTRIHACIYAACTLCLKLCTYVYVILLSLANQVYAYTHIHSYTQIFALSCEWVS